MFGLVIVLKTYCSQNGPTTEVKTEYYFVGFFLIILILIVE
jgi:hypothetical protein